MLVMSPLQRQPKAVTPPPEMVLEVLQGPGTTCRPPAVYFSPGSIISSLCIIRNGLCLGSTDKAAVATETFMEQLQSP